MALKRKLLILFCVVFIALIGAVVFRHSIGPKYENMTIADRRMSRAILSEGCVKDEGTAKWIARIVIGGDGSPLIARYDEETRAWIINTDLPDHLKDITHLTWSPRYAFIKKSNGEFVPSSSHHGNNKEYKRYIKRTQFVKDENAAYSISRAIFSGVFGILRTDEFPLTANEKKNWWIISTSPSDDAVGAKHIIIRKSNAQILAVWQET